MEEAVQKIVIISFFVIGFSHIFHHRIWANFFTQLGERGQSGSFINGFIHFPVGVLIVVFHPVWKGIPIIITLIGYGFLIKGAVNFIFPNIGLKLLNRISVNNSKEIIFGGILMVGISCLLCFSLIYK